MWMIVILVLQVVTAVAYTIIQIRWGENIGRVLGFVLSPLWIASAIFCTYVYFESSFATTIWSSLMLLVTSVSSTFSAFFNLKP